MLDFTLKKYKELCDCVSRSSYKIITVERYLSHFNLSDAFTILRHDVDRKPARAEKMALIESDFGIKATYYFRKAHYVFKPEIMKRISAMGHEIGYHYEVLDKAKGNIQKAYLIFKKELTMFRDIANIKSVAMHGNPLTGWINSDFWKHFSFDEFHLSGDASLSIKDNSVLYFTDTGRNWNPMKYNRKDFISNSNANKSLAKKIYKTDDLIRFVSSFEKKHHLYLSIHPNRWNDSTVDWLLQFGEDFLVNQVKLVMGFLKPLNHIKNKNEL